MADFKKDPNPSSGAPFNPDDDFLLNSPAEEILKRFQSEMRRQQPTQESVTAMQRIAAESIADSVGVEDSNPPTTQSSSLTCQTCGHRNRPGSRFCGMCGLPLETPAEGIHHSETSKPTPQSGPHHYHHHYHHHYFSSSPDLHLSPGRAVATDSTPRDAKLRNPGTPQGLSRAEAAVRKVTQDWAVACNSRQLDDLVSTYATDAIVMRPNHPAIRGTPAIREFFFTALDAGLGEVELEVLRVDVIGEVAYEAGRCKMLVPTAIGKRREDRGKYLMVLSRQSNAEWRIVADCWSSDLSLSPAETDVSKSPTSSIAASKPLPRKSP
jgi:ketosteroid isomerase-like protein